jgi:hypothetical protein
VASRSQRAVGQRDQLSQAGVAQARALLEQSLDGLVRCEPHQPAIICAVSHHMQATTWCRGGASGCLGARRGASQSAVGFQGRPCRWALAPKLLV